MSCHTFRGFDILCLSPQQQPCFCPPMLCVPLSCTAITEKTIHENCRASCACYNSNILLLFYETVKKKIAGDEVSTQARWDAATQEAGYKKRQPVAGQHSPHSDQSQRTYHLTRVTCRPNATLEPFFQGQPPSGTQPGYRYVKVR